MEVMRTRGKRVAWLAGAVTIALLIGAGIVNERRLRERWWLYKLRNGDEESQEFAARKFGEIGSLEAIPELLRIATDRSLSRDRIHWAFFAISQIGHGNPEGLPLWIDALGSDDRAVCMLAVQTISYFGERGQSAIPALIRALYDERSPLRLGGDLWTEVVFTLGQIGAKGSTALTAALNDLPPEARHLAERLLATPEEDVPPLPPASPCRLLRLAAVLDVPAVARAAGRFLFSAPVRDRELLLHASPRGVERTHTPWGPGGGEDDGASDGGGGNGGGGGAGGGGGGAVR